MSVVKFFLDPSQILLCLGTVIATIVATVFAYHEKKRWWIVVAVPLSGILVYAGTVYASYQQSKDEAEIVRLTQENGEQQKYLNEYYSGGRMMCFFRPHLITNELYGMKMEFRGDYKRKEMRPPIYDLKAYIMLTRTNNWPEELRSSFPLEKWFDLKKGGVPVVEQVTIGTAYATENPSRAHYYMINLKGGSSQVMRIHFYARNGDWVEVIQFENVDGNWVYAITIIPSWSSESFIKSERIMPDNFPRDKLINENEYLWTM